MKLFMKKKQVCHENNIDSHKHIILLFKGLLDGQYTKLLSIVLSACIIVADSIENGGHCYASRRDGNVE